MTHLPTDGTVVTIIFEYDAKHGGKHAIDFITHYYNIEPHNPPFDHPAETINPRQDYEADVPAAFVTWPIPAPPMTNTPVPGEPDATFNALPAGLKLMTLYGGTFSGANPITYPLSEDLQLNVAKVQFQVSFVPTNSTAILAWGGHIATQLTWGQGESAVGISGSPYHMRLIDWNLNNLGNQDRSCSVDAVYTIPPCDFTGPGALCESSTGTYAVDSTNANFTYAWSLTQNGTNASFVGGVNNTASVDVNSGTQAGSFTICVIVSEDEGAFTVNDTCCMDVIVSGGPSCLITGDTAVCPSSTNTYSGPAGDYTYQWSISGDGSISGSTTGQTVDVDADFVCPGSYTVMLTVTDTIGCSSNCDLTVSVSDSDAPVISGVGADASISCPGTPVFSNPTASDNCDDNPTITHSDVTTPGNCPQEYSVTRTWTATDACGNSATASQTISVYDNTPPVISGVGADGSVECPATPQFSNPSASDLCDDNPTITHSDVITPGN